jgi:hypothetical protein
MATVSCAACGKEIADDVSACPHCGQPTGKTRRRRGLPVWGKLLVFLILPAAFAGIVVATKPSEAELRQAIRDKGKELQANGVISHLNLIDDPKFADRFTYHDHLFTCTIKFTKDSGTVITVASGQLGTVDVFERY